MCNCLLQVIPFLVLAVGVDNLFIIVHTYNRLDKTKYISISDGIGDALGQIGPSILLTSLSECCCFAIGSISDMPAVRTFALYAAVAILIDFLLQVTAFVALMSFDQNRYMVCECLQFSRIFRCILNAIALKANKYVNCSEFAAKTLRSAVLFQIVWYGNFQNTIAWVLTVDV